MKLERLSATRLEVAMECLARFKAEHVDGAKGQQGSAASFGTFVHACLEEWVTVRYINNEVPNDWNLFKTIIKIQYQAFYPAGDPESLVLAEKLLKRWFDRGDLENPARRVVELENKKRFILKVGSVEIPFTYIIDRLDEIEDVDGTKRLVVVDYKTSAWNVSADELRDVKIQPRVYALAIQMEYPDADGVWVEFDMLKHENQPIGVYFSKEQNRNTLRALRVEAQRILDAPDNPKPTINDTCLFCPTKTTCPAAEKLINAGGTLSLGPAELVDRAAELEYAEKMIKAARGEVERALLEQAKNDDVMELSGHNNSVKVTISRRRNADAERIAKVVGSEVWEKWGSPSISMSDLDAMIKSGELNPETITEVREYIKYTYGEPRIKAEKKKTLTA